MNPFPMRIHPMTNRTASPAPAAGSTRRELFSAIWAGGLGLLALIAAWLCTRFAMPRVRPGEFGGIVDAGLAGELPNPGDPPVNHPRGRFWMVRTEAGFLALYKACTHLDCLFDWNPLEGRFICPCHGSRFGPDGAWVSGPAPRGLDRFVIEIRSPDGALMAETDGETGAPLAVMLPPVENDGKEGSAKPPLVTAPPNAVRVAPDCRVRVDTGRRIAGKEAKPRHG